MASQPGRRRPYRFWYWTTPTPTASQPAPTPRPAARAPPRAPRPPEAATPPSRRPSKQSPTTSRSPSPTQEASQLQKEAEAQEVSPAPSLYAPSVSQPELPTKKPVEPEAQDSHPTVEALSPTTEQPQPKLPTRTEAQTQSLSEPASQPPGAGNQTAQVPEPETASVDTVLGTTPTQNLIPEGEHKEIEEQKSVTSEEESEKQLASVEEKKPQIDTDSKQDKEPSQLPPVKEKQAPQVDGKSEIVPKLMEETQPSQILKEETKPEEVIEDKPNPEPEVIKKEEPRISEPETAPEENKTDEHETKPEPSQLPPVKEKQAPQVDGKSEIVPKLMEETQPSQILKEETKPEEVIEDKPNPEPEVIKKEEPRISEPETAPEENKTDEHETKPEAPQREIKPVLMEATQPSQIPKEEEKHEEITGEEGKAESEVIQKKETGSPRSATASEENKNDETKRKPEAQEAEIKPKLIEKTQPSQIPKEEEETPTEIIKEKPNTELEVLKEKEPRSPKSETASEKCKNDEPKAKTEALPAEKSTLPGDESKDRTEIKSSITEPDTEAPGPHPDTIELRKKHWSPVRQINLDEFKRTKSTTGTIAMPWAPSSRGERANFRKEINEAIFELAQMLKLGQSRQLGSESGISIITLAGENKGATMSVGHETTKKESVLHIKKKDEASSGNEEIQKQMLTSTEKENPAVTASINSNVQGINNSLMHESSSSEEDPGIHLVFSIMPNVPVKSKERAEKKETFRSAASTHPAQ